MKVRQIEGEPDRFFVQSDSDPDQEYLVDMDHGGHPVCGCIHHEKRIQPKIDLGETVEACKHVRAVQRFVAASTP